MVISQINIPEAIKLSMVCARILYFSYGTVAAAQKIAEEPESLPLTTRSNKLRDPQRTPSPASTLWDPPLIGGSHYR
jgi:hypothetical protein